MKRVNMAVAAATLATASLFSIGWSDQGVSISANGAQAAPRHMAMHRHHGHRYGPGPVAAGAGLAAGAVGVAGGLALGALDTAGAIATAPFGGSSWDGDGYYASSTWGDYDCRQGGAGCRPYAEKWAQSGPSSDGGRRDVSRPGGRGVSRKPAN